MRRFTLAAIAMILLGGQIELQAQHPAPQPRPGPSSQTLSEDGSTTVVVTPEGHFPSEDPFGKPPGTNFLDTIYTNAFDGNGVEMPNTLPSTPTNPYNLHPDPEVSEINPISPTQDLKAIFERLKDRNRPYADRRADIQRGIDILEGNPVPDRVYSGIALLHYNGPDKVKVVTPIFDENGVKVGGNVDVHQIWFDSHIESDTAMIDPSAVLDVPWTITYSVDTLHRGHEDFSPMVMYTDDPALSPPGRPPMPHIAMDQTFFPMEEGTRTVYKIGMAPGKYYNLTYHWGWRVHPPRVQVSENARKRIQGKSLVEWETSVFGESPTSSEAAKLNAISMIGDLAPAKRMWKALRLMKNLPGPSRKDDGLGGREVDLGKRKVVSDWDYSPLLNDAIRAFGQWKDRTKLPDGVSLDPKSDITLFYANNTIYGDIKGRVGDNQAELPKWNQRPYNLKVKLINGDYFLHAYVNVDFGGSRGWENQFQSTVDIGGSGPWFTFGRFHWWINAGAPPVGLITVSPAERPSESIDYLAGYLKYLERMNASKNGTSVLPKSGEHLVDITFNYEPSRRLRIYQFDPLHHDVAVWSVH